MRRFLCRAASRTLLAGLTLAIPASLHADMVTLHDGSRLVGAVERFGDGRVIVHTEFAGKIEVTEDKIRTISTDEPVFVRMETGDQFVGTVDWTPETDKGVVNSQFGKIPFDMSNMTALWPEDGKSPETIALEAQIEKLKPKYKFTAEAGLTYLEGNSNQLTARGRIEWTRTTIDSLFQVFLLGEYAEQNDIQNAGEVRAGALYELNITDRWYWYLRGEAEYDEFENLQFRGQALTGVGYYFIKKEKHMMKGRVGAGFIHESFFDMFERTDAQAEVGLDYRIDINDSLQFTSSNTYLPTFNSLNDYRFISDNAFLIPLNNESWKLKLGALYQYDPIPRPGFQRLDQTYYANILVQVD